jgi:hypothetical protein
LADEHSAADIRLNMSLKKLSFVLWALFQKKPLESVALLLSVVSFGWLLLTNATMWASSDIRSLIQTEANAAINRNTEKAVSLFTSDGVIIDWQSHSNCWGEAELRQRYGNLPQFKWLVHVNVNVEEVQIIGGTARATSTTGGQIFSDETAKPAQVLFSGDIWEFKKVNRIPFLPWTGEWKISSFTFNKPQ